MSYAYQTEGIMARYTTWDTLVAQIMANLNILETHLGITPTKLYSLDTGVPKVFSWKAKNGEDIKNRIDSVRSSIGFDNFEWRTGFNPTDGTQYMSFDDLAMIARAVGVPGTRIPKSEVDVPYCYSTSGDRVVTTNSYQLNYKPSPVNIQGTDYDLNFSLTENTFFDAANPLASSFFNGVNFRITAEQWKSTVGFNKLRVAYSYDIQSDWTGTWFLTVNGYVPPNMFYDFQFGLPVDPEITGKGAPTMGYTTGIPNTNGEFKNQQYLYPVQFTSGIPAIYPEEFCGEFGEYYIYDSVIGDPSVSPQLAFLSNASNKKAKRWDFEVNHVARHQIVAGYDQTDRIYRVTKADESAATAPGLNVLYSDDGITFDSLDTASGSGVISAVSDWTQTSANYYFGCIADVSGLDIPEDIPLSAPSEYYQYGTTPNTIGQEKDNGVIMKRAAIYAETELTPPFIWMASRR